MQLQLQGPDLDELLARVRRECGSQARIVQAEKVRTGGFAGFFSRESFEVLVEVDDATAAAPSTSDRLEQGLDTLLVDLADRVSEAEQWASFRAGAPPAAEQPEQRPSTEVEPATQPVVSTESASFREVLADLTRVAGVEDRSSTWRGGDALASLLRAVRRFPDPPAPPTGEGELLVLVGDTSAALRAGRDLVTEMHLPADALTLVTRGTSTERLPARSRASGPESAEQRRVQWSRRPYPTVVVVDSPVSLRGTEWAAAVLGALQPTSTWAVTEASRKPDDVAAWVHRLGGVDALAVDDLDSTADPATVLSIGLPVARLDGRPATRSTWAALLAGRLSDLEDQ